MVLESSAISPTDAQKIRATKAAIYHLMLDSQMDLIKSDGDKICCAKLAKKRKRSSSTPDPSSRSPCVSAYEAAVNSGEEEPIRKFLHQFCVPLCVMHIDMSALSADPRVPLFRELRGLSTILSYLNMGLQAVPDSVSLFWQKGVTRTDAGRDIEADCHFLGKKVFDIELVKDATFDSEQSQLETAISGLTALAGGGEAARANEVPEPVAQCSVTSIDSIKMLVAGENVHFRIGSRLGREFEINHKGSFTWHLDGDGKVYRMKFLLKK